MTWAFNQAVSGNDKLVLLALADNADADGSCFPSHAVLAKKASVSERTVQTVLGRLQEAGLIHWERRNSQATGYRSTNRYYLHIDGLTAESAVWPNGKSEEPNGKSDAPNGNLLQFEGNHQKEPSVKNHAQMSFDEFWNLYPRKVDKIGARRAWNKAIKTASVEVIMAGLRRYLASVAGKELTFVAHPSTWLNRERWNDDYGGQIARVGGKPKDPNAWMQDRELAPWQEKAREAGML